MTGDARLPTLCCPTPIAIHYDRDMAWQTFPINRRQEHRFAGSFLYYLVEVGEHSVFSRGGAANSSNFGFSAIIAWDLQTVRLHIARFSTLSHARVRWGDRKSTRLNSSHQ